MNIHIIKLKVVLVRLISFWVKTLYNIHPRIRAFIGGCQRAAASVNTRPLAATNESTNPRVDVVKRFYPESDGPDSEQIFTT